MSKPTLYVKRLHEATCNRIECLDCVMGKVDLVEASRSDLLAAVRAAVESGTIEGGKSWRCEHRRGGEKLCREVNAYEPTLHKSCGWVLVIPLVERGEGGNK